MYVSVCVHNRSTPNVQELILLRSVYDCLPQDLCGLSLSLS